MADKAEKVRVMRIVVYEGERSWVEQTVGNSIHGKLTMPKGTITGVTISQFPEILDLAREDKAGKIRMRLKKGTVS